MLLLTLSQFDFKILPDIFPSSYFSQSHITHSSLEEIDFLTPQEKSHRIHFNYVFHENGSKIYPFRDNYFAQKRASDIQNCKYRYIQGYCTVYDISDDEFHVNHAVLKMEFQPKIQQQKASDLMSFLTVNYQNPSYEFLIEKQVQIGKQIQCEKRELFEGKCVQWDFEIMWE